MTEPQCTRASVPQRVISAEATEVALHAAVEHAAQIGVRINVAVVDTGGNLAGFLRMPGAFLVSVDMAIRKARSTASLGISPEDAEVALAQEEFRVREGLISHGGFTPIHGSLPLYQNGYLLGAIGVSGAAEAQDVACCRASIAALLENYSICEAP